MTNTSDPDAHTSREDAQRTADALARATGSVRATCAIERREADGTLVTIATATSTNEFVQVRRAELEELRAMRDRAAGLATAVGPIMRRTAAFILTGTWPEARARSPFGGQK
jgi:hypothetical protein